MAKPMRAVAVVAIAALALAACGSSSSGSGGGGGGGKTVIVATDLPLQGQSKDASDATNQAVQLYLDQQGGKAGNFTVKIKTYDDSTAAKGSWDDGACTKNANDHVANADEVAVLGTYNSGCAKIELPILNQDPNGPMLMVSHANTNPGLTKAWDQGEPAKYYPTGTRNYARVIATDDFQGAAAAKYLADKGIKSVYVLNDNQTYGQGVAKAFAAAAATDGITVLGNDPWDAKQTSYASLFTNIKAKNPGAIYLAGIYDNNGGQLVKDKVAVLGDQKTVPMMAPDGFTGYPELQKLPQGEGLLLSFTGQTADQLKAAGGTASKFLDAYKTKYGKELTTSFALYGVAAIQVILAAIAKSDGTRKGVVNAAFGGSGISVPAAQSITGADLQVDPKSGDMVKQEISIELLTGGKETFVKVQPVG